MINCKKKKNGIQRGNGIHRKIRAVPSWLLTCKVGVKVFGLWPVSAESDMYFSHHCATLMHSWNLVAFGEH